RRSPRALRRSPRETRAAHTPMVPIGASSRVSRRSAGGEGSAAKRSTAASTPTTTATATAATTERSDPQIHSAAAPRCPRATSLALDERDEDDQQQDQQERNPGRELGVLGLGDRFAACDTRDVGDRARDAVAETALAERRRHVALDDAARDRVG